MARTMARDSNRIVTKQAIDVEISTNTLYSMIEDNTITTGGKAHKGKCQGMEVMTKEGRRGRIFRLPVWDPMSEKNF